MLALASYVSAAHANMPRHDLDLLYHDGRAHGLDNCLGLGAAGAVVGEFVVGVV